MSRKLLQKVGLAGIVLFAIKGLAWLGFALLVMFSGCR